MKFLLSELLVLGTFLVATDAAVIGKRQGFVEPSHTHHPGGPSSGFPHSHHHHTGRPTGFPGFPTNFPSNFPTGFPGFPTNFPSGAFPTPTGGFGGPRSSGQAFPNGVFAAAAQASGSGFASPSSHHHHHHHHHSGGPRPTGGAGGHHSHSGGAGPTGALPTGGLEKRQFTGTGGPRPSGGASPTGGHHHHHHHPSGGSHSGFPAPTGAHTSRT